jgi:hypothetical protein
VKTESVIKAETRVPSLDFSPKTGNATLILPQARRKIKRSPAFRRKNAKKKARPPLLRRSRFVRFPTTPSSVHSA